MIAAVPAVKSLALVVMLLVFAAIMMRRFVAVGHSRWTASLLSAAALAQPAYFAAGAWRAALLSIASYAVAGASIAFVQRQDPRRIVLLGGSLAGAQLIAPIWGAGATVALPFALRRSFAAAGNKASPGLYVCLLFLPSFVMLALIYLALFRHMDIAEWDFSGGKAPLIERIGAAAVAMLCAGPLCLLLTKRRSEYGSPVLATLAVVIVATSAMAALLGVVRAVLASSAALAALSALAASRGPMRLGEACMAIANFLIGWLLLLGLSHV